MISQFPNILSALLTGNSAKGKQRLRVDVGQTGFFEGREFRSFCELNIAAGATFVIRVTSPINFILSQQSVDVDDGFLRFSAVTTGGTPGGSFSTPLPVIGKNRMTERPSPNYSAQVTLDSGGTYTGGTEVEVIRVKSSSGSNFAATVKSSSDDQRGLPAGTYYLRFQNIGSGTVTGVYTLWWEEREALP